ncbi:hypothetical protein ACFY78_18625 [Streptomyces olindensis]|uniref:hypothetical protein n=1 Tax=Streptomyces olindensis TaxID=358823 RepID=UPI0036BAC16B
MSTQNSELQLADEARTALLEAVTKAAKAGRGEEARALAEAYAVLSTTGPREQQDPAENSPWFRTDITYEDQRLKGRR